MICTIIFQCALLLIQPARAFVWQTSTSLPGGVAVIPNQRVASSLSTLPYTFTFTHHNPIFQKALGLSSNIAENDNGPLLSELYEVSASFEQVKKAAEHNTRQNEELLVEYEDKVRSLEAEVFSSRESIRLKDAEVEASRKQLEDMTRSVEGWSIERVTMAQRLKRVEDELSERKVKLEEKERELAASLGNRLRSLEEAEVLTVRLEEMEKEATKRIEEVATAGTVLAAEETKKWNVDSRSMELFIQSLEAEVFSSKESVRSKDAEVEASRIRLEEMKRSVEEWGIERVEMAQRLKGMEDELSERKVKLEEKERELAASLDDRLRSLEEVEVKSRSMEAFTIRLEEMEKEAAKRIEVISIKNAIAKAAQVKQGEYQIELDRLKQENEIIKAQLDESKMLREEAIIELSAKEQEAIRKGEELEEKQKLYQTELTIREKSILDQAKATEYKIHQYEEDQAALMDVEKKKKKIEIKLTKAEEKILGMAKKLELKERENVDALSVKEEEILVIVDNLEAKELAYEETKKRMEQIEALKFEVENELTSKENIILQQAEELKKKEVEHAEALTKAEKYILEKNKELEAKDSIAKAAHEKQNEYRIELDRLKKEYRTIKEKKAEVEKDQISMENIIVQETEELKRKEKENSEALMKGGKDVSGRTLTQDIIFHQLKETRMSQESSLMEDNCKNLDEEKARLQRERVVVATSYDLACDSSVTTKELIAHFLHFYITDTKMTSSSRNQQQQQNYDTSASVYTALRETYNSDSFAQYIAAALQGGSVYDFWTTELLGLPEYRGDVENAIYENEERYGWLSRITTRGDNGEVGESLRWAVDRVRVEMALENMEMMQSKVDIGRGEEMEEVVERRYFVGKRKAL